VEYVDGKEMTRCKTCDGTDFEYVDGKDPKCMTCRPAASTAAMDMAYEKRVREALKEIVHSAVVAVLRYRYRYRSSVRTTRTRTYVHGTVLHVVHMYTNTGIFVLYMYILIHAYMYSTESKVLGLDQIGVFQTTEPSL